MHYSLVFDATFKILPFISQDENSRPYHKIRDFLRQNVKQNFLLRNSSLNQYVILILLSQKDNLGKID
ncbi:Uncharacterized protein APZ42_031367 [Daphnia magna]|uniref:Uncharacterized protein n=1 Tax=Daphnia magna TaxID=35525 RepID=A0A164MXG8_9CRUS|nr:Uncharacterized protein APZ42_031367 [Daphnia magna]